MPLFYLQSVIYLITSARRCNVVCYKIVFYIFCERCCMKQKNSYIYFVMSVVFSHALFVSNVFAAVNDYKECEVKQEATPQGQEPSENTLLHQQNDIARVYVPYLGEHIKLPSLNTNASLTDIELDALVKIKEKLFISIKNKEEEIEIAESALADGYANSTQDQAHIDIYKKNLQEYEHQWLLLNKCRCVLIDFYSQLPVCDDRELNNLKLNKTCIFDIVIVPNK